MLLPLNALDFVVQSQDFKTHINNEKINPDAVNSVSLKHSQSQTHGHVFKIYFDYGIEGQSNKDFVIEVKIINHNLFEIL